MFEKIIMIEKHVINSYYYVLKWAAMLNIFSFTCKLNSLIWLLHKQFYNLATVLMIKDLCWDFNLIDLPNYKGKLVVIYQSTFFALSNFFLHEHKIVFTSLWYFCTHTHTHNILNQMCVKVNLHHKTRITV